MMRRFHLMRVKDVSGVSGTGRVASGIEFEDGQTVLSWLGQFHSLEIHPSAEQLLAIHGHGGATTIEWVD